MKVACPCCGMTRNISPSQMRTATGYCVTCYNAKRADGRKCRRATRGDAKSIAAMPDEVIEREESAYLARMARSSQRFLAALVEARAAA